MSNVRHLSNSELLAEFSSKYNPPRTNKSWKRRAELCEEILRRLNEPWRAMKESIPVEQHNNEINALNKEFYSNLNSLNYRSSMRHQINNIKRKIGNKIGKKESDKLDPREYYG